MEMKWIVDRGSIGVGEGEIEADSLRLHIERDGLPHGLPEDGGRVLIGYKESWVKKIYETLDHRDTVRVLRHQSATHWDILKEAPGVVALVQGSGLWPAIFYAQEEFDAVTNSAFCERFCPETYTFHLRFGEMEITPNDAHKISGLRTHGKNVYSAVYEMTWDDLYVLAEETLGLPKDKTELEFACGSKEVKFVDSSTKKLKKIKFTTLKKCFGDTNEKISKGELVMDEVTSMSTATAYLLHTLGSVIFPDNNGNKVNAQYLQLLKYLKSCHKYSWGTAALSFLFEQLGTVSRLTSRNIGGYFTMLQVWIYDHFPDLNLVKEYDKWVDTFPTSAKWSFKKNKKRNKKEILIALRENLDSLTTEQVVFQPYKKDEEDDDVVEDEDMPLGMESQALVDGKRGQRTQKEVEPKTRKKKKGMVEDVSKSYRTMMAGGNDVFKVMKKKIDCNVDMEVEEQEYMYNRWVGVINKGEGASGSGARKGRGGGRSGGGQ
ncbi:protein MAINTENANCE OF MERISTEMS-like [Papaver somniferum]|uniref:protein MAINTENANCE OF MERISTEMS-like n=1 Tax=Papaver somniferum TaxID=3469 RepID=UPI000E700CBF|nr:protein MAINTENANCE OF MERISTEMS-like [Papaver somniferum]